MKDCKAGLNRALHEFRVLKANEDVPYIPHTLGIWHRQFLGMNLVISWEGDVNLQQAFQKGHILTRRHCLRMLLYIATAMERLHANG